MDRLFFRLWDITVREWCGLVGPVLLTEGSSTCEMHYEKTSPWPKVHLKTKNHKLFLWPQRIYTTISKHLRIKTLDPSASRYIYLKKNSEK